MKLKSWVFLKHSIAKLGITIASTRLIYGNPNKEYKNEIPTLFGEVVEHQKSYTNNLVPR